MYQTIRCHIQEVKKSSFWGYSLPQNHQIRRDWSQSVGLIGLRNNADCFCLNRLCFLHLLALTPLIRPMAIAAGISTNEVQTVN